MEAMKKTAVEWFEQQLDNLNIEIPFSIFEEAKEIEKQQTEKAYDKGFTDGYNKNNK
jgi:hypothetical protein